MKKKKIIVMSIILSAIMISFALDNDKKPHFKVIRATNDSFIVPIVTETKTNINSATVEELDELPGIGPVIANRIIEYRQNKPFSTIEDIMNVKGIGEKIFAGIKDIITVR